MVTLPEHVEYVRLLNSEINTHYYFGLRTDRLAAFCKYLAENRSSESPQSAMPGISGAAHYALDCIFFGPKGRFPAQDILNWIRDQHSSVWGEVILPPITSHEVEEALGKWASTVTQLQADGKDRE